VSSGFARGTIKLIHGRWIYDPIGETPEQTFATLARTFNENAGPRVFVHAFGMICGHGPSAIPFDDPKRTSILGEVHSLTDEVHALTEEVDSLRLELLAMKQSKSWKVTQPMRFLRRKFFDL
jgi:hypothetical protein